MTEEISNNTSTSLFVDLDGTLIKSDILIESFFALLKINFLYIILVPIWLLEGKAYLKQQIAQRVAIDTELLPYNKKFLKYLRSEVRRGRKLFLTTASNKKYAIEIANHLKIFKGVLASSADLNLSGKNKLKAILEETRGKSFDYAGNATIDLKIWSHAKHAILVNPRKRVELAARRVTKIEKIFHQRATGVMPYLKAMRLHQWLKNLLLFVPLVAAHEWNNIEFGFNVFIGFWAFNLAASSVYLLNDMLDLPSDRGHPVKHKRPLAAGDISYLYGTLLIPVLFLSSITIAATLSWNFLCILLVYLVLTLAYSLYLKSKVLIDVIILATLYTIRVIAGAAAFNVIPSFWLLAFAIFIFLSLALVKRCSELNSLSSKDKTVISGRGYRVSDLYYLHSMGISSGYLSILVLALFINSPEITAHYSQVEILWLLCLLVLYWISRLWLIVGRNEMSDDPLIFAVKDRKSVIIALLSLVIFLFAL